MSSKVCFPVRCGSGCRGGQHQPQRTRENVLSSGAGSGSTAVTSRPNAGWQGRIYARTSRASRVTRVLARSWDHRGPRRDSAFRSHSRHALKHVFDHGPVPAAFISTVRFSSSARHSRVHATSSIRPSSSARISPAMTSGSRASSSQHSVPNAWRRPHSGCRSPSRDWAAAGKARPGRDSARGGAPRSSLAGEQRRADRDCPGSCRGRSGRGRRDAGRRGQALAPAAPAKRLPASYCSHSELLPRQRNTARDIRRRRPRSRRAGRPSRSRLRAGKAGRPEVFAILARDRIDVSDGSSHVGRRRTLRVRSSIASQSISPARRASVTVGPSRLYSPSVLAIRARATRTGRRLAQRQDEPERLVFGVIAFAFSIRRRRLTVGASNASDGIWPIPPRRPHFAGCRRAHDLRQSSPELRGSLPAAPRRDAASCGRRAAAIGGAAGEQLIECGEERAWVIGGHGVIPIPASVAIASVRRRSRHGRPAVRVQP